MAITRTLVRAVPIENTSDEIERWDLEMTYSQGTEGNADYYEGSFQITIEDEDEYFKYLVRKVVEEINEFYHNPISEEMADVMEVLMSIIKLKNIDVHTVESTRIKKLLEKGRFDKKYVLKRVIKH